MLERYGANEDGVTNDDTAIQAATKVARQGSQTIYLAQGKSGKFTTPIAISGATGLRDNIAPWLPHGSPMIGIVIGS